MTIENAAEKFLQENSYAKGACYKVVPNKLFNNFFEWLLDNKISIKATKLKTKSKKKQIEHFSIFMPKTSPKVSLD